MEDGGAEGWRSQVKVAVPNIVRVEKETVTERSRWVQR